MSGKTDILKMCENNNIEVIDLYNQTLEGKRTVNLFFASPQGKQHLIAPTNGRLKRKLIEYLNERNTNGSKTNIQ